MSHSVNASSTGVCPGPGRTAAGNRRGFLQAGLAGFASLSLPGILRLQSESPLYASQTSGSSREKTAVIMVHPWGVDVSTGVESSPGHKDPEKMTRFVASARAAFAGEGGLDAKQ